MLVTMDRAGRVVIPKSVRDGMGLRPDEAFELAIDGSAIRLELVAPPSRLGVGKDGLPILRAVDGPGLTHADVRALRDGDQR
jgi:AbrB family looped-hinge helix DNA binding protein